MWFDTWGDLVRVLVVGAAAYVTLVVVLRSSGKRTLAKLNAFDLVVTVAFGSTLATILLSSDVSWAEGATALALLAALQYVVAWTTSRWPDSRKLVVSHPTLLLRDGEVLDRVLIDHRIARADLLQAVRATGAGDLSAVAAVVLEADGSMSVISTEQAGDRSALEGVGRPEPA